jgi:hypothetical protein
MSLFIDIPLFLLSLFIGLLFVYMTIDENSVIMIYPNPENHNNIQYVDHNNNAFEFTQLLVDCNTSVLSYH